MITMDDLVLHQRVKLSAETINLAAQIGVFEKVLLPECDVDGTRAGVESEMAKMTAELQRAADRLLALAASPNAPPPDGELPRRN